MPDNVTVNVVNETMWKELHEGDHQVSVTKPSSLLKPSLWYSVQGLDPEENYSFSIQFIQVDHYDYKRQSGNFVKTVKVGEFHCSSVIHCGTLSQTGKFWQDHGVVFKNVRLTNHENCENINAVHVFLRRKYTPVLTIKKEKDGTESKWKFEFLNFIAVSTIDANEVSKRDRKRKSITQPDGQCSTHVQTKFVPSDGHNPGTLPQLDFNQQAFSELLSQFFPRQSPNPSSQPILLQPYPSNILQVAQQLIVQHLINTPNILPIHRLLLQYLSTLSRNFDNPIHPYLNSSPTVPSASPQTSLSTDSLHSTSPAPQTCPSLNPPVQSPKTVSKKQFSISYLLDLSEGN